MAKIQDYISGKVCDLIKTAHSISASTEAPLNETDIGLTMLGRVKKFAQKNFQMIRRFS